MANLEFRASYFKKHNEAWDGFSTALGTQQAAAVEARPPDSAVNASLLLDWIIAFKSTADYLEGPLLERATTATRDIGDKLEATCRLYLYTEAQNAAEADRILASVGY